MKKRNILIVALVLVMSVALMLTACTQQAAPAAESEAPASEPAAESEAPASEPAAEASAAGGAGGQTATEVVSGGVEATGEPRMVEEREDATDGTPLIAEGAYTEEQMPGLESAIGVKPLKKYKVAFSNGDMNNDWRATFFNDFVEQGEYMKEQFGIDFIYANSGNDSAKQLQDAQALLAQKPDLLMISPNESAPLAPIYDLCNEQGIPFFTIDRAIDADIGTGQYICDIEGDNIACGISMGMAIVEGLTEKNGEPKGTVGEIAGAIGSSPGIQRAVGVRMVLDRYPDIKIIQSVDGDFDADTSNKAAQDIFTAHPDIDAIINGCDASAMQAVDVAESMGIEDVIFVSVDGDATYLRDYVTPGRAYHCAEYPPYFATTAWEYAIHYLNGEAIPSIVLVPEREFMTNTEERAAKLAEINEATAAEDLPFVPASLGGYDVFQMGASDPDLWTEIYPQNWAVGGGAEYLATLIPDDPFAVEAA